MDMHEFLRLAKRVSHYGDAIVSQFEAVAEGESMDEQNSNALRIIRAEILPELDAAGIEGAADLMLELDEYLGGSA